MPFLDWGQQESGEADHFGRSLPPVAASGQLWRCGCAKHANSQGDNLLAFKALQPFYAGRVKPTAQLEQTRILLEDAGRAPKTVVVDLGVPGCRCGQSVGRDIHRGKYRRLSRPQRGWLKRRQAVEPAIGDLKADHRMDRCWLKGQLGDALLAVLCAAGYNLR